MRTLAVLALCLGALAMTDAATADDQKTFTSGGITYTEQVTVKVWVAKQKEFLNPMSDVWALRIDKKDAKGQPLLLFRVRTTVITNTPTKGSIITDKAGNEYECLDDGSLVPVKLVKKAEPKKP